MTKALLLRTLPFALYVVFLAAGGYLFDFCAEKPAVRIGFYAVQLAVVVLALFWALPQCEELKKQCHRLSDWLLAVVAGVAVFVLWIFLDIPLLTFGTPEVFDPYSLPAEWIVLFIALRFVGSVLIVPVFEELFWRSFILRYIINSNFLKTPLAAFSWLSFIAGAILFGMEHYFWFAGIVAGMVYSLLLYRSKSLYPPMLSHAVTNLLLGIYVVTTQKWIFW